MRLVLLFVSWIVLCSATTQSSHSYDVYPSTISPGQYSDSYTNYPDIYDLTSSGQGNYVDQTGQQDDYSYPYSTDVMAYAYEPELEQSTLGSSSSYESGSSYDLADVYQPSSQVYSDYEPVSIYNVPYEASLSEGDYLSDYDDVDTEYYQPHLMSNDVYSQENTDYFESVSKADKYYDTPDYYAAYDAYAGSADPYDDSYGVVGPNHPVEQKSHPLVVDKEKDPLYEYDAEGFSDTPSSDSLDDEGYTEYNPDYDVYDEGIPNIIPIEPHFYRPAVEDDQDGHTLTDQIPMTHDALKDTDHHFWAFEKPREPVAKRFDRYGKDQSSLAYVPYGSARNAHRLLAPSPREGHAAPVYDDHDLKDWSNPKSDMPYNSASGYESSHKIVDSRPETFGYLGRDDHAWKPRDDRYASVESKLHNEPAYNWKSKDVPHKSGKHEMFKPHFHEPRQDGLAGEYRTKGGFDDFALMERRSKPHKYVPTEKESQNQLPDFKKLYDESDGNKRELSGESSSHDFELMKEGRKKPHKHVFPEKESHDKMPDSRDFLEEDDEKKRELNEKVDSDDFEFMNWKKKPRKHISPEKESHNKMPDFLKLYDEDHDKKKDLYRKSGYDDLAFIKRKKKPHKQHHFTKKEPYYNEPDLKKLYDHDDEKKGEIYVRNDVGDSDLLHDVNYKLKSGIIGEGKFLGFAAQEKGTKYQEVTEFHHGGSFDKYGKHKTRYGGYDSRGKVEQYGEEKAGRKHMIHGTIKAQGKGDGLENGYLRGKLNRMNHEADDENVSENIKIKGSSQTRPARRRFRHRKRRSHKKRHGYRRMREDGYNRY